MRRFRIPLIVPDGHSRGIDGTPGTGPGLAPQLPGWITNASVLQTVAAELSGSRVLEISVGTGSRTAGTRLGTVDWPAASIPVCVLRGRVLRDPDPELILEPGDRISVLARLDGPVLLSC
jgi:hypothetical protein